MVTPNQKDMSVERALIHQYLKIGIISMFYFVLLVYPSVTHACSASTPAFKDGVSYVGQGPKLRGLRVTAYVGLAVTLTST